MSAELNLWMFQKGIPYFRQTIFTYISQQVQLEIPLPKQLPTDIGRIFGLSIYSDTFDPSFNPLITSTQAQNLYLKLKDGSMDFITPMRLDDLNFNYSGRPEPSGLRYLDINIPGGFDLSTSSFLNPTSIVSAPGAGAKPTCIMLNLWYFNVNTYRRLIANGLVLQNGLGQKEIEITEKKR